MKARGAASRARDRLAPMSPAAASCLASAALLALSEQDSPMLLWLLVGGLLALGPALHSWVRVIEHFKGKTFDAANYVTQAQLASVRSERDAQMAASLNAIKNDFDRLETTLNEINRDLPNIHRALGRLEGHDDLDRRPR